MLRTDVDRVDVLRRQVRVDRQLVNVAEGAPNFGAPKSRAGFAPLPMPAVVTEALCEHLAHFATGPEGLASANTFGCPLQRSASGTARHRARRQAEIPEWATFHDVRHFYASLLIARGRSVKVVQRRLGHQSAMETLDTYAHLWTDSDDETRDAVDQVLGSNRRGELTRQARGRSSASSETGSGRRRGCLPPMRRPKILQSNSPRRR